MLKIFFLTSLLADLCLSVPVEIEDIDEELTGPQPSVIGSVDKVLKSVNKMDQYQCIQKMICEFMGSTEEAVVNSVASNFGQQTGQLTQNGINQFQNNPAQFVQNLPNQINQNGQLVQAVTSQFNPNGQFLQNGQFAQNGQFVQNVGGQLLQQGLPTQFGQGQFNQFNPQQNQFQTQFQQNQFQQNQFQQNQLQQNQFQQNQFQQNQFQQNQFQQNQFSQNQFAQQQQNQGGLLETLAGGLASNLLSGFLGKKRRDDEGQEIRRKKRQTTAHGQAIKMMQSFGLDKMGLYPYVRAAIIGHANKERPKNCRQLFRQCPDSTDQLLNYLNNHNGGLFQNAIPSATSEVGNLFPGLSSLPQVAASTFGELAASSTNNNSGSESGFLNGLVDTVAGMLASATGRKK